MHNYSDYFPIRSNDDKLDVAPVLYEGLRNGGERTLLTFDGVPMSFTQMAQRVAALQRWLAASGIESGDRVALMLDNGPEHIALIYALILSGVIWIPVNTRLKGPGVSYLIGHCKPKLFIAQREFAESLQELEEARNTLIWLDDIVPAEATLNDLVLTSIAYQDKLCLIYTSGTTGAPKGVVFTHRMMRIASEATVLVADARDGDRMFVWEPLCHIGGAQMLLVPFLKTVELHIVAKFSARKFWSQVTAVGATHLHYLGGILDILMQMPPEQNLDRNPIRIAWGAGISAQSWDAIQHRMGFKLRECYGMTECSSFATVNTNGKPGSIGRVLPWLKLELLDEEGHPVPTGEIGQIVLSSDIDGVFFSEYLNNPEATAATVRNGKLHTGDSARLDHDGDLYFVGRRTDSMRVRGENVSAWEIERVFATHPAVAASAAVGVGSEIGEQEILLYVQFNAGAKPDFEALAEWAESRLASFQLPRYFMQTAQFETTLSERIKKHLLARKIDHAWDRFAHVSTQ
jgi:crotonobetaine/carnitine-CoA ligase